MKKLLLAIVIAVGLVHLAPRYEGKAHAAQYCVEFYRDNLFLGLAYHRIGCMTNWSTVQSNQDYDGFTYSRYCYSGTSSNSVPGGEWFDGACWSTTTTFAQVQNHLNAKGTDTNVCYATPNYQDRSNVCSYNIANDCNSDCWIRNFSQRSIGREVASASGCWGAPPVATVNGISCDK